MSIAPRFPTLAAAAVVLACSTGLAAAFDPTSKDWMDLSAAQMQANSQFGTRNVPAHAIPVPTEGVSPQQQKIIGAPYAPNWKDNPRDAKEWKAFVQKGYDATMALLPAMRETLGVTVEPTTIAGVKAFIVRPRTVPAINLNRVLLHLHGGGYVLSPGEAGTREAIMMAAHGGFRVISVDYRMPPDFPAPAAMDDSMAVYREILKTTDPKRIAVFGTSTGGGMTLALIHRARDEGLPLPAVIAPGTPWSDLTETGDTYFSNEFADNILVSWKGWLGRAALLYANGQDMKHPYLSPVYGDFRNFPPTILTSGTRDLFLSNTVRVHRKLRQAGVEAVLNVFEGQSHAQYYADPTGPETVDYHAEVARFFDRHMAR